MSEVATEGRKAPLWLLALITFAGTLAMHIFVPALPVAARDLGASMAEVRMTISLYIIGLAFGQLIYGPLSDRFGRRRTLMGGLLLYTVAGFAALFAPDIHWLIVARLFQALGGCSGLVLGRAIVRDTSAPNDAARRLALMNLMVVLGPGAAPIIGDALATHLGWRSIYVLLCGLGVANMLLALKMLPETGGAAPAGGGRALLKGYLGLIRSPRFLGLSLGGACATTSMYAFVASAPFIIVDQLHRPSHEVGFALATLIVGVFLGSLVASRLLTRMPMSGLTVAANAASVLAAFLFLGAALTGQLTIWVAVGSLFLFTLGAGTASPAALTLAIGVNPKLIGSASGLYGFGQMAVGAICTTLAGFGNDPALAAALVLAGSGIIAQLCFWMALRR